MKIQNVGDYVCQIGCGVLCVGVHNDNALVQPDCRSGTISGDRRRKVLEM